MFELPQIFTRWVNQRLAKSRKEPIADVVDDLAKGNSFVDLLENLSELKCPYKMKENAKFKAQVLENLNLALRFMLDDCKVQMTLKPSSENLYDGDLRAVLGMIWALMMKYLKFAQEDGENLSPKEALLRWVNLNTAGHAGAEAKDFKKSFHNGLVLCALLHKFRPDLIDYESLSPENATANLQ